MEYIIVGGICFLVIGGVVILGRRANKRALERQRARRGVGLSPEIRGRLAASRSRHREDEMTTNTFIAGAMFADDSPSKSSSDSGGFGGFGGGDGGGFGGGDGGGF